MLAQSRLAQGDRRAAEAQLDSARAVEPAWALEIGALGGLLPHAPAPPEALRRLRDDLERWDPARSTPGSAFFFATHADVHEQIRVYLLALLSDRLGEGNHAARHVETLRRTGSTHADRAFAASLARSADAHRAWLRGDPERTLALLEEERFVAPLERIALSPFFSRAFDRFLRAEALAALGRPGEALRWYASVTEGPDVLFWPAADRHRSEILSRSNLPDVGGRARP